MSHIATAKSKMKDVNVTLMDATLNGLRAPLAKQHVVLGEPVWGARSARWTIKWSVDMRRWTRQVWLGLVEGADGEIEFVYDTDHQAEVQPVISSIQQGYMGPAVSIALKQMGYDVTERLVGGNLAIVGGQRWLRLGAS
jgi:hypothetical protein